MRVLILSGNTGEGHNSCARAIKEIFDKNGEVCVIEDGFRFISRKVSQFLSKGHTFVYRRIPALFDKGYSLAEEIPESFSEDSVMYNFFAMGCKKLYDYIVENDFDTVISSHPLTALMLTEVQREHSLPLRTAFVATDYTCSPSVKDSNLDLYFIPDDSLRDDFRCLNIPEEKMVACGIPIRQMFYESINKAHAKEKLSVSPESRHLVITCGSMGCGPIRTLVDALAEKGIEGAEISVLCGTNHRLYEQLLQKYESNSAVHIRGFVKNMSLLLDSTDLYLTKAGGISVSEALQKNLPMIFVKAVGGCENYNRDFFVNLGGAVATEDSGELIETCEALLNCEDAYEKMKTALVQKDKCNAALVVYETIKSAAV